MLLLEAEINQQFSLSHNIFCFHFDREILSTFTEEQMNRYEAFRRSGFRRSEMKRASTLTSTVLFWMLLL
jgi:hTAFII28-like protein conserved region